MSDDNNDVIGEYGLKIKVINFIELAYKENDKLTVSIVKNKGAFTLKVNQDGDATLSGKSGIVRFSASEATEKFGVDFKYASIMFFSGRGKLNYTASFGFSKLGKITYTSFIDIEKLVLSCSGLLCIAARAIKARYRQIDSSIQ